jgi:hypothetical protein
MRYPVGFALKWSFVTIGERVRVQASKRQIKASLDPQRVAALLRSGVGGDAQAISTAMFSLQAVLQEASQVLAAARAPARDAKARHEHTNLERHLQLLADAVDAPPTDASSPSQRVFAVAVAASLEFAFKQLQVLRRDCANARLAALAPLVGSGAGAECARRHFARRHGLSDEGDASAAHLLPRTAMLMRDAVAYASTVVMPSTTPPLTTHAAPAMHTGRGVASVAPPLLLLDGAAVEPTSWEGLLRVGLLQIARRRAAVSTETLPETLVWDTARLFHAQELFQRLLVVAACLLLVTRGGTTPAASMEMLAQRFGALLTDDAVNLAALTAEIAAAAGTDEELTASRLSRMLDHDSSEGGLIEGVLAAAVALRLLGAGVAATHAALARCGVPGRALSPAVDALAAVLARVGAVTACVHGPWYQACC